MKSYDFRIVEQRSSLRYAFRGCKGRGRFTESEGVQQTAHENPSPLPFQTSHPRCHQSDSCRESSFPFVSSPEFLTARWGSLRRPLTPATLGASCCGDVPSRQASARAGVGPASAAARWRLGRARLLRFGANYKVAVATASKAGAQSPVAQRRCPAPRRAPRRGRLTLTCLLSFSCRVASDTRSSSNLRHLERRQRE